MYLGRTSRNSQLGWPGRREGLLSAHQVILGRSSSELSLFLESFTWKRGAIYISDLRGCVDCGSKPCQFCGADWFGSFLYLEPSLLSFAEIKIAVRVPNFFVLIRLQGRFWETVNQQGFYSSQIGEIHSESHVPGGFAATTVNSESRDTALGKTVSATSLRAWCISAGGLGWPESNISLTLTLP